MSHSSYRDMDASAFGFPRGQTPFSPHPVTVQAPAVMPEFPCASCSTGANVISDHASTRADLADMEYAALNEVAMKFGIALIGFKGISDGARPLTGELTEWTAASCHRQEPRSGRQRAAHAARAGRTEKRRSASNAAALAAGARWFQGLKLERQ